MDNAVALVQAYLHLNGYLTVTEFPVLVEDGPTPHALTDLDVLAFRFPGAGSMDPRRDSAMVAVPDPALGADPARADMILGEVKEGRARLNGAALDRRVIEAALVRFGCCDAAAAPKHVRELVRSGATRLPAGHALRLVIFAGTKSPESEPCHVVTLGQVVGFLRKHVREHWEVLRHVEWKDPALGFLVTIEKALATDRQIPMVTADRSSR
jgi:hypothetical protein